MDDAILREVIGYLNFSNGQPDAGFQRNVNRLFASFESERPLPALRRLLLDRLAVLKDESETFADSQQAVAVTKLVCDECVPAYQRHHADLLFHLSDEAFEQPFFIVRVFEATLAQRPPWDETERIVNGTLDQLNDFIGYRPFAVLENGRQMQPYPHERFRTVPLYLRDAGVACGVYHDLVESTIECLKETPDEILHEAHFDLTRMNELTLDVRAHDHTHPVNKRTNYMFGEWDPHLIDTKGFYQRFVLRKIILDALLGWMEENEELSRDELLHDASAVLCGTMLMASAISGSGPDTHDSTVTLTSLLPKVARQRDAFYSRLVQQVSGARGRRLRSEAKLTQQPFGHVRQHLNMELSSYGALQVQHRQLAELFARLGYHEASQEEAMEIPSSSTRFECEIGWRITSCRLHLERSQLTDAVKLIEEMEDFLKRGIECGALVDPWNVLGFQAQFPLFSSREDSIPDSRVETLLELMERIFGVYARALGEAAAQGETALVEQLSEGFEKLADFWDKFATSTVEDLPAVSGHESWESAKHVSRALSEWRKAGQAAGDISFWQGHVDRFQSAKAYAVVVEALLEKRDHVAAMGLLMQWLSHAEEVGLESGPYSIHTLLIEWMNLVTQADAESSSSETATVDDAWPSVRRLFDYLEANAGVFWSVPDFGEAAANVLTDSEEGLPPEFADQDEFDDDDSEDQLYQAAYDQVVFRDSAEDGHFGETLDGGFHPHNTEFEIINRHIEPRLKFLNTLAQLWQIAAAAVAALPAGDQTDSDERDRRNEVLLSWHRRTQQLQQSLDRLLETVWNYDVSMPSGDHDSNIEYDIQLQTKFYLLYTNIATYLSFRTAERSLLCCLPAATANRGLSADERQLVGIYRGIFRRDAAEVRRLLPRLLKQLAKKPLLYIPFDNGGHPGQVLAARNLQTVIRFLLSQLPKLGLLRETKHLLATAYRMERGSRPGGLAVTEFDRLFRTALRNSLECVVQSSAGWKSGQFSDEDLIEIVGDLSERYLQQWLKHSKTMRLSSIEMIDQQIDWEDLKKFIVRYGADLFHATRLTLGNVRAILHDGVEHFLDYLAENQDPLQPCLLLDDLELGHIDPEQAVDFLELIYGAVVDKFDRFLEYNTTTTQSDYGEMFYCLLDFLQVEVAYDRDDWNLAPVRIAHEVLAKHQKHEEALIWERIFEVRTSDMADRHLDALSELEQRHGMQLPSITDHLNERFVKPLAVNRMIALVPRAAEDARLARQPFDAFETLRAEIDDYMENAFGSGIDVPPWLRSLEDEVDRVVASSHPAQYKTEPELNLPPVLLNLREMRRQLKIWNEPLEKKQPQKKKPPKRKRPES